MIKIAYDSHFKSIKKPVGSGQCSHSNYFGFFISVYYYSIAGIWTCKYEFRPVIAKQDRICYLSVQAI